MHWLGSYINTYIERDVRQLLNVHDTGLACRLLGIESSVQLSTNLMRGHLFENMVISDLLKQRFNQGLDDNIYFWRSSSGHEVDVIIDKAGKLFPVEIKSGVTIAKDWFAGLLKWKKLASDQSGTLQLLYGGNDLQKRGEVNVVAWRHIEQLLLEE